jgi:hypothetical protein
MPRSETRAWWADVEDVRASIERRREREARDADRAARDLASREPARRRAAAAHGRRSEELGDARAALSPAPDGNLDRSGTERRGRFARSEPEGEPDRRARLSERGRDELSERGRDQLSERGRDRPQPLAAPTRRRTVEITGRTVGAPSLPRLVEIDRRRPSRRAVERVGPRPDRVAMWAVILGFFLILVAFTSASHAATPASPRGAAGHVAKPRVAHASVAVATSRIARAKR